MSYFSVGEKPKIHQETTSPRTNGATHILDLQKNTEVPYIMKIGPSGHTIISALIFQ